MTFMLNSFTASRELCEILYALTDWGGKCDAPFYYDPTDSVRTRDDMLKHAKRSLPDGWTPAYNIAYCVHNLDDYVLMGEKHHHTACCKDISAVAGTAEDAIVQLCIELVQRKLIKV